MDYDPQCKKIASFAATVIEAKVLAALQMKTTDADRKKRIDAHVQKVGEYSKLFGVDMAQKVFSRLLTEGMNKVCGT